MYLAGEWRRGAVPRVFVDFEELEECVQRNNRKLKVKKTGIKAAVDI